MSGAEKHPGIDDTKQGYLLFPYLYHRVIESGDVTLSLRYSVVIGYCGVVIGHCVICIEFLRYYCMEEFKYPFENLNAWQEARKYVVEVYRVLETFPQHERFALCDQIRRAVISVPSNIAEGSGRMSYKEKIHFLEIAYGSLMEVYCQLQLSADLGYISQEQLNALKHTSFNVSKLLSGLRKSFEQKLNNQ